MTHPCMVWKTWKTGRGFVEAAVEDEDETDEEDAEVGASWKAADR